MSGLQEEDIGDYYKQKAQLLYVLNDIRDLVTSVPLDEPLSAEQLQDLETLAKDLWNERIMLALHKAMLNFQVPAGRFDIASQLEEAKTDVANQLIAVLSYDKLKGQDIDVLKARVHKHIADETASLNALQDKSSMNDQLRARVLAAMIQAEKDLNQIDRVMLAKNPALKKQGSYVFASAGAFIGALCTALVFTVAAATVGIGLAVSIVIQGGNEILSARSMTGLIGKTAFVGLCAVIGAVATLVSLPFAAVAAVQEGSRTGAHAGKRIDDAQYKCRSDLLYSVARLESKLDDMSFFKSTKQNASDLLNYYDEIFRIEELQTKFNALALLNEKDEGLVKDLKLHFKRCLSALDHALQRANDSEDRVVLNEQLQHLEQDWRNMERALKNNDLADFKKAAQTFLLRVNPDAAHIHKLDKRKMLLHQHEGKSKAYKTEPMQLANDAATLLKRLETLH